MNPSLSASTVYQAGNRTRKRKGHLWNITTTEGAPSIDGDDNMVANFGDLMGAFIVDYVRGNIDMSVNVWVGNEEDAVFSFIARVGMYPSGAGYSASIESNGNGTVTYGLGTLEEDAVTLTVADNVGAHLLRFVLDQQVLKLYSDGDLVLSWVDNTITGVGICGVLLVGPATARDFILPASEGISINEPQS